MLDWSTWLSSSKDDAQEAWKPPEKYLQDNHCPATEVEDQGDRLSKYDSGSKPYWSSVRRSQTEVGENKVKPPQSA